MNNKTCHKFDIMFSEDPVSYPDAIDHMQQMVDEIIADKRRSTIWLLEHPPIYTAGRLADDVDLLDKKFPIYHSERGGKYTYHGPGQRIIYLMYDLRAEKDIKLFIKKVLHAMQHVFIELGIRGTYIDEEDIGIWINKNDVPLKLVALGIRIKKWVTYHGIAINICPDLTHYAGIIPCGIKDKGVTSLAALGYDISYKKFDELFIAALSMAQ